jgi:hypothetical protein
MHNLIEHEASPVFGLRYLEDREVDGLDVVGCLIYDPVNTGGGGGTTKTSTGCDDSDVIQP